MTRVHPIVTYRWEGDHQTGGQRPEQLGIHSQVVSFIPVFLFFYLIYLAESYSTYNKNIVRTYIYIYNNNKYHMYILSKKPRITQKVVKLISLPLLM